MRHKIKHFYYQNPDGIQATVDGWLNQPAQREIKIISITSESQFVAGQGIWHTLFIAYEGRE